jgi:hypothetical protein
MRWAVHIADIGEIRSEYKILIGEPEGRRPHGRPRHIWQGIKMDLGEIGLDSVNWIHVA